MHSPSHASATVDAKAKKRDSRSRESMGLVRCVVKERKEDGGKGRRGANPIKFNEQHSTLRKLDFEPRTLDQRRSPGEGRHSYSPVKLNFRSTIKNDEV